MGEGAGERRSNRVGRGEGWDKLQPGPEDGAAERMNG